MSYAKSLVLLEITSLNVAQGQEEAFEKAFLAAQLQLAKAAGYITHELQRGIDGNGRYALLVEWRDRTRSQALPSWRESLEVYLSAPTDTHHYELIAGLGIPPPIPALRYPD